MCVYRVYSVVVQVRSIEQRECRCACDGIVDKCKMWSSRWCRWCRVDREIING